MDTFSSIINSNTPVLVDFYATWCGPCKAMAPAIEAIGKEVQGSARVLKIDVDRNPAVASKYQIQAVPTLAIFKNGQSANALVKAADTAMYAIKQSKPGRVARGGTLPKTQAAAGPSM